ncbi:MAG: class I SAM-dependent methyltransferase [Anaerolineae bacterium]|nr:class I SAM-dependent methyltransferase [Anaerolineae bacterium]
MTQPVTFSFGENWLNYIQTLDEEKLREAEQSLAGLLGLAGLAGKTFIDIGAGSGIFSLAAVNMGAQTVVSLDADPQSIRACQKIKQQADAAHWTILEGSILDQELLNRLPRADIVYAWGALHHTGAMWQAIDHATTLVNERGLLVISIYNRHWSSGLWLKFKQIYNRSGNWGKKLLVWLLVIPRVGVRWLKGRPPLRDNRGMSVYYDAIDWAGGLPYEYASLAEVARFCRQRGFVLQNSVPTKTIGCNQFVFIRKDTKYLDK